MHDRIAGSGLDPRYHVLLHSDLGHLDVKPVQRSWRIARIRDHLDFEMARIDEMQFVDGARPEIEFEAASDNLKFCGHRILLFNQTSTRV